MSRPYQPKRYEVAGFDLIGHRQKNGSIKLGPEGKGTPLATFPDAVTVLGVTYTLENVKRNKDVTPLPEDHAGYNIEWGEYV